MGLVTFSAGDTTRHGYLAVPEGAAGAGVLLLHAWWGLTPFFTILCDRLAGEGFAVFAPDLNHGKIAATIEEAEAVMAGGDNAAKRQTALAALDYLRGLPSVLPTPLGAVGFSMGAMWALELLEERPTDFAAMVFFYGATGAQLADVPGVFLGHYGEEDTWDPVEEARQMAAANVTVHVYPGAGHWFFESDRPENYDAAAATLAYERTVTFLKDNLTPKQES